MVGAIDLNRPWGKRLRFATAGKHAYYPAVSAGWKKFRHRLEWAGLVALTKLVPLLPRMVCYGFAQFAGSMAARFDRAGCRVAVSNLELAFGDQYSPAQRMGIVRESYQHFVRTMVDLLWSPRLTSRNFSRYVEMDQFEPWRDQMADGHAFVLGCYHYSNFEWLSLASAFAGYQGSIISQEFKNPLLDSVFKHLREQSGHEMVAREGGIIRLYKALRRGGRVAILVDLTIPPKIPTVAISCFGMQTSVTFAHAWLHERTGAPIVTAHCEPLSWGRYRIVVHPRLEIPAGASVQQIAQACWDRFEPYVRRNPAPWLWMYKHWRYRPSDAARGDYPFYANVSEDFEIRLAESKSTKTPSP